MLILTGREAQAPDAVGIEEIVLVFFSHSMELHFSLHSTNLSCATMARHTRNRAMMNRMSSSVTYLSDISIGLNQSSLTMCPMASMCWSLPFTRIVFPFR